jgi:S-adenosylmethionine uptake transporter
MSQSLASHSAVKGPLLALIGFAAFSTHDALLKSLSDYSVFQIIFFAMLFGYVPFSIVRLMDPNPGSIKANNLKMVVLRALLMVISLCCAFLSFKMLPMVQVYVLLFTAPLLITVMAIYFLGEQVHLTRWAAILLGMLGVLIVLRPSIESVSLGHLFGLIAALSSAGAAIISRKIGSSESPATMILFPLLASILITGCMLPFVYKPMELPALGVMFLIGIFGQIGQLMVFLAYRAANAAFIAPMQYSQIVWAVIFGALFFNESADRYVVLGAAITIASGILIVWREAMVSKVQANLQTRNSRMVSAAPAPIIESDNAEPGEPELAR